MLRKALCPYASRIGLYFAKGKERVKQHRLKEPDKSKYEIYTAVKNEIEPDKSKYEIYTAVKNEILSNME